MISASLPANSAGNNANRVAGFFRAQNPPTESKLSFADEISLSEAALERSKQESKESDLAAEKQQLEAQQKAAKSEQDALRRQMEAAKQEAEAQAESMEILRKCLVIASRLIAGHKVPRTDEKYLMKNNFELYRQAMTLRMPNRNAKEYRSILSEKDIRGEQTDAAAETGESGEAPQSAEVSPE